MRRLFGFAGLGYLGFGIAALTFLAYAGPLRGLLSANYLPHRYCYLAQPWLIWTNVTMDVLIAASYGLIFGCLFWIASRLRKLSALQSYLWIFIGFGTFILACGATHAMEVVTVWWPVYPLSAVVKVVCAAASVLTAVLFARITPALSTNIRHFIDMLSTTQEEKEQALLALVASEKLAVAGRISTAIAHEIKDPLQTAGDLLFLVAGDERIPSDLAASIRTAKAELNRASSIAHNTLSLYRESQTPIAISLAELVSSVIELQNADMVRRNIGLHPRLRTSAELKAHSGELRQILINLIQNAAAAIGKDGDIVVRVQPRSSVANSAPGVQRAYNRNSADAEGLKNIQEKGHPGYSITIADNGPGVAPENRSRLFTLFFTTKGELGTGLGLWLVRSMVEKQGGRIRFRSRTSAEGGKSGTIFNVWIPLQPTQLHSSGNAADTLPSTSAS